VSHRALSPQQFDLARDLGLHPSLGGSKAPEVVQGRAARHIMAQANVRMTGRDPEKPRYAPNIVAPHVAGSAEGYGNYGYRPHHEELWTSQSHLHLPTLARYAQGDIPVKQQAEPDYGDPDYEPETYEHGGKRWIAEGHHRTVATRLAR
jgi:hypothetical protein